MKRSAATALLFLALGAAASSQASSVYADDAIVIADVGPSAVHWPVYAALEEGYFKQAGVDVQYVKTASSAAGLQELAAGSVNLASSGRPDSLRAIDKGAPITLLRIEQGPAPYQVYAKPQIRAWAGLRGKQVILGGLKDITRLYFERMAASAGLPPGSCDLVFAGSNASRLAALVSGSVDAAILGPPFNFKAQDAKFTYLPAAPDYAKGVPFTDLSVNTDWSRTHHALIGRFLAAYAKGVDWFYDPAHREKAVDMLVRKLSVDRSSAEKTYDFYLALKAFDRAGAVTKDASIGLIRQMKKDGDIEGAADFSRFYRPDLTGVSN